MQKHLPPQVFLFAVFIAYIFPYIICNYIVIVIRINHRMYIQPSAVHKKILCFCTGLLSVFEFLFDYADQLCQYDNQCQIDQSDSKKRHKSGHRAAADKVTGTG